MRRLVVLLGAAATMPALAALPALPEAAAQAPPVCAPGGPPVAFSGTATPDDARTYLDLAFDVAAGTTRVEVTYDWTDPAVALPSGLNGNVFDLGLWDGDGIGTPAGFRGWSGSRAGRVAGDQPPVFVQQDVAQRGYRPAPIEPGTWHVDLGIAAIDPAGSSDWTVAVTCTDPAVGPPFVADPVDPTQVADPAPGWYRGDFHMHGYHSNLRAPEWQSMVDEAVAAGLDFLPITEYVTGQHWDELGAVQLANPATLLVPGREIITYFGHANAIGETRSVLDYRHGYPGVSLADIQAATVADGALFQVNHPTIFPGPVFRNFCRGCEFTLGAEIDWDAVDTIEVLTGPALVAPAEIGIPSEQPQIENPFMLTALSEWQDLLREGHRITAVSGSDSKGVEDGARRRWGTNATAVYAESLSRPAIFEALRAGHAYVQTRGAAASPTLEFSAVAAGPVPAGAGLTAAAAPGQQAMMGDTLHADRAEMTATITGGLGQVLVVTRDGLPWLPASVPITADPFTYTWTADRSPGSGTLGTFWRVDVRDAQSYTVISNPIFLAPPSAPEAPPAEPTPPADAGPSGGDARAVGSAPDVALAVTGADRRPVVPTAVAVLAALVALAASRALRDLRDPR